jgi:methionine salvage enolase-phosphatase E1
MASTQKQKIVFGGSVAGSLKGLLDGSIAIAALPKTMSGYPRVVKRWFK